MSAPDLLFSHAISAWRCLDVTRPLSALLALSLAVSVGCGSTAQQTPLSGGSGPGTAAAGDGLSLPGTSTEPDTAADGTPLLGEGPGTAAGGNGGLAGPTTGTGSAPAVSGPSAVGVNGPGVDATSISIGVAYAANADEANAAMGADSVTRGNVKARAQAIIADINKRGGVGGRTLKPVWYAQDAQSVEPYAQQAQKQCEYFTRDHKVLLVVDGHALVGPLSRQCLQNAGVAMVGGLVTGTGASDYRTFPFTTDPITINLDRLYKTLIPELGRSGYFAPWNTVTAAPGAGRAKLGVMGFDYPSFINAAQNVVVPELRKLGYAPDARDVVFITLPSSLGESGPAVAEIQNAVLKFAQDGVTHVLLMDAVGSMTQYFMTYAATQGYYPRLGGQSGNAWQVLIGTGLISTRSLNGALGIGWLPLIDLPYAPGGDGPFSNPARASCLALLRREGHTFDSGTSMFSGSFLCDIFRLVQQTLPTRVPVVNRAVLFSSLERLGTRFGSASSVGMRFDAAHHDGAGAYYRMAYDGGCQCVKYSGSARPAA